LSPSLFNAMERLVYSIDWKAEEIATAGSAPGGGESPPPALNASTLKAALVRFQESLAVAAAVGFRVSGRRLYIDLPPAPTKGRRAQDIVQAVLGIDDPVFLIRRDEVSLKNPAV
jgi:hypothetical protein